MSLGAYGKSFPHSGSGWRVADARGIVPSGGRAPVPPVSQAEGSADPPLMYCHETLVPYRLVLKQRVSPSDVEAGHFLRIF